MTEKILSKLQNIHESASELGEFAVGMLRDGIDAFEKEDLPLAKKVRDQKTELKNRFIQVEESIFRYIALYQPVARDMREIVASLRIIYNFERIGRMGFDISETTIILSECCELIDSEVLLQVAKKVMVMIEDSLSAYKDRDVTRIRDMRERDSEIDRLYCDVMKDLIRRMEENPDKVQILTRYVIIDRYLERCGDQACNISEMTLYMVTGERVEIS